MSTIQTNAIVDASGGNTATVNGHNITSSNMMGRNLIINGSMIIDQRNKGSSITPTNNSLTLDRWKSGLAQTSKFSLDQDSESPAGFNTSMKVTSLTAYTPSSNDHFFIEQEVEGYNTIPLALGSSDAKDISISFWVRSSLTGTFAGSVINSARNRSRVFEYTINTANTWEHKTVSFVGDTTGTWLTTNGKGVSLRFNFGAAGTWLQNAGSWSTGNVTASSGSVNLVATNNATLYLTGVQLEVGKTSTDFEHRSYGEELALCQRYLQVISGGSDAYTFSGKCQGASSIDATIPLSVSLRASPTMNSINSRTFHDAGYSASSSTTPTTVHYQDNNVHLAINCAGFSGLTNNEISVWGPLASELLINAEL